MEYRGNIILSVMNKILFLFSGSNGVKRNQQYMETEEPPYDVLSGHC